MQVEDPARARVGVVDRLSRPLDDAVAQRCRGDPVAPAEVEGDHLLAVLGHPVGVLRVARSVSGVVPQLERRRRTAGRGSPTVRARRSSSGRMPGVCSPCSGTVVEAFAHRRLRRRHHHPLQVEAFGHGDLEDQRRRRDVDVGEPREVGQVVLVGGEVEDRVAPAQQVGEQLPVAHVADEQVGPGREVGGPAVAVHRRRQRVEHDHVVAELDEPVAGVRADEPRSPGHQDPHARTFSRARCWPLGRRRGSARAVRGPGELGGPRQAARRGARAPCGPHARTSASASDSGDRGRPVAAAPPAVSAIALRSEVTTGQPQAIASRMGSPKVSLKDG